MGMTVTKIEWVARPELQMKGFSWNPITGCYNGCDYCYARRIAMRFQPGATLADDCTQSFFGTPKKGYGCHEIRYTRGASVDAWRYGFTPTFHSHRLMDPIYRKKPSAIFVCSMGDIFTDGVPMIFVERILDTMIDCPQHMFFMLTKQPYHGYMKYTDRIEKLKALGNTWFGVTVTRQSDVWRMSYLPSDAKTFVSVEPMQGPVDWSKIDCPKPNWVIIGAKTLEGRRTEQPELEWVGQLVTQCVDQQIPVFAKNNLEWPNRYFDYNLPELKQLPV